MKSAVVRTVNSDASLANCASRCAVDFEIFKFKFKFEYFDLEVSRNTQAFKYFKDFLKYLNV